MISESQERMLAIVAPDRWEGVRAVCESWDLDATIVGEVTSTKHLRVFFGGEMVGDMEAAALVEPPCYEIPRERPAHEVDEPLDPADYPMPATTLEEILLDLAGSPNIASRRWVWRQYDHQVQLNTVIVPGGDAALLRIKKTGAGIAVCTDGNGRHTYLDPYRGGKAAVAEAARNVSCVGAKPIAITNCLNFGNPDNGPIAYQLAQAIEGMAEACGVLGTPVISGNVSLYNESFDQPIYPTAVVGMLGLIDDVTANCTMGFKSEGDDVYLLGDAAPVLDGSEYQKRWFGGPRGRPAGRIPDVNLDAEAALQLVLQEAIAARILRSAHDCSDGGLAVALAESCIEGHVGADLAFHRLRWMGGDHPAALNRRPDIAFFGETPTLAVVSAAAGEGPGLERLCQQTGVPCHHLGRVGGADLVMRGEGTGRQSGGLRVPVTRLAQVFETALPRAMGE
jgi:phosphoribosylformylglycinamidine synthase II